jgi:5-methylcytosine-specific restriction protein A
MSTAKTARGELLDKANLEESRKLREEALKTKNCAFCQKAFRWPHRVYCSDECQRGFSAKYYGHIWSVIRDEAIKRDRHVCKKCGRVCEKGQDPHGFSSHDWCDCEVDHILEVAEGGTDDMENLQTLCSACHRKKTDHYLRKKLSKPRIHPEPLQMQLNLNPVELFFNQIQEQDTL